MKTIPKLVLQLWKSTDLDKYRIQSCVCLSLVLTSQSMVWLAPALVLASRKPVVAFGARAIWALRIL